MTPLERLEHLIERDYPKGYAVSVDEEKDGVYVHIWDAKGFLVPGLWTKGPTRSEAVKTMVRRLEKIAFLGYDEEVPWKEPCQTPGCHGGDGVHTYNCPLRAREVWTCISFTTNAHRSSSSAAGRAARDADSRRGFIGQRGSPYHVRDRAAPARTMTDEDAASLAYVDVRRLHAEHTDDADPEVKP